MTRPVEVDVFLTGDVAGTPFQIAIECKNYKKPVPKGDMDAFVGNLETLGIPTSRGVFVSPSGYTQGAKDRAKRAGIHLLRLEGLDEARMAAALNEALLCLLYVTLFVGNIGFFSHVPIGDGPKAVKLPEGERLMGTVVFDILWHRWITGAIDPTLGGGTTFIYTTEGEAAIVDYRVVAFAGTLPGTSTLLSLKKDETAEIAGLRLDTRFDGRNTVQLKPLLSEAQAAAAKAELARSNPRLVTHRIRVPRIITDTLFWPPSHEPAQRIMQLQKAGEAINFARVEGRDLSRAWAHYEVNRGVAA